MKLLLTFILFILLNSCSCQSFTSKFKIYDFKSSQPGFNLNYTLASINNYPQNGLVKDTLKSNKKPEYCCGNSPFSYIKNEQEFDKSFIDSSDSSSFILDIPFYKRTVNSYTVYDANINPFYPADGKGWNENINGTNLYWCMEGHFKIYYTYSGGQFLNFEGSGDYSVFVNGKKAMENSAVPFQNSATNYGNYGMQSGYFYPVDIFYCQRFDGPQPRIYISTGFNLQCVNYPGINDDVCPYVKPSCNPSINCDDLNPCTIDSCPGNDVIIPPFADISDYCIHTINECNDNNPCTDDFCDLVDVGGCTNLPNDTLCDDGSLCTLDSCGENGCIHTPISCDDGNACTADLCSNSTGCYHTSLGCDDDDACTIDSCIGSIGCFHRLVSCDDSNKCTIDLCSNSTGCYHTQFNCDDGNSCTLDSCNNSTGCSHTPVSCDDGNECTLDGCNNSTGCYHTQLSCDDSNPCTLDGCNNLTGCYNTPISCDDDNNCTTDSCGLYGCINTPISCDDNNKCTSDSCSNSTGCYNTPISCNDNNPCTLDLCSNSTGCYSTPISCNDNNPCTIDSCGPNGCTNIPVVCPVKKTIDLILGLICVTQKCDIVKGGCVDDKLLLICI